jgi:hypothetical protein
MKSDFEYMRYPDGERLAMLETRAAEIERMIGSLSSEDETLATGTAGGHEVYEEDLTAPYEVSDHAFEEPPAAFEGTPAAFRAARQPTGANPDDRTSSLIHGGRRKVTPGWLDFARGHWKPLSIVAGAMAVLGIVIAAVQPSSPSSSWPASVTQMRSEITVACQNPDVAAEPSQVNVACGAGTRQVLWVFALLTSGGNPGYVDSSTGRRGLEPITPAQGGDVAWSLNLHAPYSASDPADSLEVAARAINNIIGGATVTSTSGAPSVENGLESSAANCERYTGSGDLRTRAGYPSLCAHALTAAGEQALVTDVFNQWIPGDPAQVATDAGVLFANANDPGNAQVQKILASLPGSDQ